MTKHNVDPEVLALMLAANECLAESELDHLHFIATSRTSLYASALAAFNEISMTTDVTNSFFYQPHEISTRVADVAESVLVELNARYCDEVERMIELAKKADAFFATKEATTSVKN